MRVIFKTGKCTVLEKIERNRSVILHKKLVPICTILFSLYVYFASQGDLRHASLLM